MLFTPSQLKTWFRIFRFALSHKRLSGQGASALEFGCGVWGLKVTCAISGFLIIIMVVTSWNHGGYKPEVYRCNHYRIMG